MTLGRLLILAGVVLASLAVGACAVLGDGATQVAVPTDPPAPLLGQACPAALAEGRLAVDERWGVVLESEFGRQPVRWPHGYYAELEPELVLLDGNRNVVASDGDTVYVGGGMDADDLLFVACGYVSQDPP